MLALLELFHSINTSDTVHMLQIASVGVKEEVELFRRGSVPHMVEVLFVLVAVKHRESQHPASDGFCLFQQLREMHCRVI